MQWWRHKAAGILSQRKGLLVLRFIPVTCIYRSKKEKHAKVFQEATQSTQIRTRYSAIETPMSPVPIPPELATAEIRVTSVSV